MIDIKSILVPVDFSEMSLYTLSYAKNIASKFDAKIYLYHCITNINTYIGYVPSFPADKVLEDLKREANRQIEHLKNKYELINVETVVEVGNTAKRISRFAIKNDIDLIIIGAHGKSGIEKFMFGSVTEKVIRIAEIPVLVVKLPKDTKK